MHYYARALDNITLVSISNLASAQTNSNKVMIKVLIYLLNFIVIYPNIKIRFYCSSIILYIHSDRSYLSIAKGQSRVRGFYFLSNSLKILELVKINRAIHILYNMLKILWAQL